ncbi:MAG: esterase-like activity of phytase family protein [Candidatus Binatia bacterium]
MRKKNTGILLASLLIVSAAATAQIAFSRDDFQRNEHRLSAEDLRARGHSPSFQRVSTLANYRNNGTAHIGETTVSEIVAATHDGKTLVYTDSPGEQIGFVDISNPAKPAPTGVVPLNGEPTSVDVLGDKYALVAINTSANFINTGGELVLVDIKKRSIVGNIDLGGQPDSVKISPDGKYVAIAIENERDEEVEVNGVEGGLPQSPAGYLVIVDIIGANPAKWVRRDVALTGLANYGGNDPEPEFVDINENNEAVVTLQENNHIVIVDLGTGVVTKHFNAGAATLNGVDHTEDGVISLTEILPDVPREPDAVTWLRTGSHGEYFIATANEGDLFGGSRGFSIFSRHGNVVFDSGASLEEIAVQHGHYPESRSENKGTEPEAIEYASFGHNDYLFIGSERGSFIAVYEVNAAGPEFKQLLPGPLGPEGLLAIPSRNLLIASGEEDDPSFGVRSTIMIYQFKRDQATYPQLVSESVNGSPIPWSALSGMVAFPDRHNTLLAVWDSYYSESNIFRIDVSTKPAVITESMTIQGGAGNYDPEGIASAPDHTLWIASEGNATDSRPNLLLQTDLAGHVIQEVSLPQAILDCRAASTRRSTLGSGFEGVTVVPGNGRTYKLFVAQQRGWDYTTPECEELDDDAGGLNANGEPNWTRIWIYDPVTNTWDHVAWELAPLPANASWIGLSEITLAPDDSYIVLERDNRTGDFAKLKTLVKVPHNVLADGLISNDEKSVYDMIPELKATNGWITDKPEGVAITRDGRTFVVTDNDGVEDWSGETWFLDLGHFRRLFR